MSRIAVGRRASPGINNTENNDNKIKIKKSDLTWTLGFIGIIVLVLFVMLRWQGMVDSAQ